MLGGSGLVLHPGGVGLFSGYTYCSAVDVCCLRCCGSSALLQGRMLNIFPWSTPDLHELFVFVCQYRLAFRSRLPAVHHLPVERIKHESQPAGEASGAQVCRETVSMIRYKD